MVTIWAFPHLVDVGHPHQQQAPDQHHQCSIAWKVSTNLQQNITYHLLSRAYSAHEGLTQPHSQESSPKSCLVKISEEPSSTSATEAWGSSRMRQKVWPLRGRPESRRSGENFKSLKKLTHRLTWAFGNGILSSFKQVPKSLDRGMKQIVPSQSAFVVQFHFWSLILSKQSWSEQLDIVLSNGCPSLSPVCKVKCGGRKALKMGQGHIATSSKSTAKLNQLVYACCGNVRSGQARLFWDIPV